MTHPRTTITDVEPLADRWLRLTFADGAVHTVGLSALLSASGVFSSIRDDETVFRSVVVDGEFGIIAWPGDIELDPDVLRGDQAPAGRITIPRRIVQLS